MQTVDAARQNGSQTSEDAYMRQLHYLTCLLVTQQFNIALVVRPQERVELLYISGHRSTN